MADYKMRVMHTYSTARGFEFEASDSVGTGRPLGDETMTLTQATNGGWVVGENLASRVFTFDRLAEMVESATNSPTQIRLDEQYHRWPDSGVNKYGPSVGVAGIYDETVSISNSFSMIEAMHNYTIDGYRPSDDTYVYRLRYEGKTYRGHALYLIIFFINGIGYFITSDISGMRSYPSVLNALPLNMLGWYVNIFETREDMSGNLYGNCVGLLAGNYNYSSNIVYTALGGTSTNWCRIEKASEGDGRGLYPGLPSSRIALRQNIPGGIDFRHNIALFDESSQSETAMFLTNRVGLSPYEQIHFTTPNGTLRIRATETVNGNGTNKNNFTHFVASTSFAANAPLVFRVTSYTTISADVMDIGFEIDYVKTYFAYCGITEANNPICLRTTDSRWFDAGWTNMIEDTAMFDGSVEEKSFNIGSIPSARVVANEAGAWVAFVLQDQRVFACSYPDYINKLCVAIQSNANGNIVASQIKMCYLIPQVTGTGYMHGFTATSNSITFSGDVEGAEVTVTFTSLYAWSGGWVPSGTGYYNTYYDFQISGPENLYSNWVEKGATWEMSIPFYGKMDPPKDIIYLLRDGSLNCKLVIDALGGKCAIDFYTAGTLSEWSDLPQISIPSNSGAYQAISVTNANTATTAISSLAGLGVGLAGIALSPLTGGASLVAAAGAGTTAALGIGSAIYKGGLQKDGILANAIGSFRGGGGTASLASTNIILTRVTPNLLIPLDEWYAQIGYPNNKLWIETGAVSGETYWLEFPKPLKIPNYIAEGFRRELAKGITYNY